MSPQVQLVSDLHLATAREYLPRMADNKVEAMRVARQYGPDYWDGLRRYGYGGYRYDGRWKTVAERLIQRYELGPESKILDLGCGKAHLLHELRLLLPTATFCGLDLSAHALAEAPEAIRPHLRRHDLREPLPFSDQAFDLVLSVGVLHNLRLFHLLSALAEMKRVGRRHYLMVESYRDEQELFNLQCWALTAESFFDVDEWAWLFEHSGYDGDFEFIFFR